MGVSTISGSVYDLQTVSSAPSVEAGSVPVGRWRIPRGAASTTRALTQDTEFCVPVPCAPGQTFDRVAVEVTTLGAGGTVRVGLRQDSNGLPAAAVTELGTVDPATTGTKELTVSFTATGHRVWLSVVAQSSAAVVVRGINGQVDGVDLASNAAVTGTFASFTQTGVTAAFPATAPTTQVGTAPIIGVRAAS